MKKYKNFLTDSFGCQSFLCRNCEVEVMLLQRCQDTKSTLHTSRVVIVNVSFNHANQLLFAIETPAVIPFPFQDSPEPLHRPVVNAVRHTGHALRHSCPFEFVVERPVRVLESPVAVEKRMRIRIRACW